MLFKQKPALYDGTPDATRPLPPPRAGNDAAGATVRHHHHHQPPPPPPPPPQQQQQQQQQDDGFGSAPPLPPRPLGVSGGGEGEIYSSPGDVDALMRVEVAELSRALEALIRARYASRG